MRLKITVGGSVLLLCLFAGCVGMPEKPIFESGDLDLTTSEVICGLSDGSDPLHREPLASYDKATCFKPSELEKLKVYVKLLEDYAERNCKPKPAQ